MSAPKNFTAVQSGSEVQLSWELPDNPVGVIMFYRLGWSSSSGGGALNIDFGISSYSLTLHHGVLYDFDIHTLSNAGPGDYATVQITLAHTYNENGWCSVPEDIINQNTGTLYDSQGFNKQGFNVSGYNLYGFDANGYDAQGYDAQGYNAQGYNASGYDAQGYNSSGYDYNGFNVDGFNTSGWNADGINQYTGTRYNSDNMDINGNHIPEITTFTAGSVVSQGIRLDWGMTSIGPIIGYTYGTSDGGYTRRIFATNGSQAENILISIEDILNPNDCHINNMLIQGESLEFYIQIEYGITYTSERTYTTLVYVGFGIDNPTVTGVFTDSLRLNFTNPTLQFSQITNRHISCAGTTLDTDISSTIEYTISPQDLASYGMVNGTYTITYTITDNIGQSSSSSTSVPIVLVPPAPAIDTPYIENGQVFLSWLSDFPCKVYRNGEEFYTNMNSPASWDITPADYNQTYSYSVLAQNEYGLSDSANVMVTLNGVYRVPSEPSFVVEPKNEGTLVKWYQSTDNGNDLASLSSYVIKYRPDSEPENLTTIEIPDWNTNQYRITGLTNGVLYRVAVIARNSLGNSVSNPLTVTPAVAVPDTPVVSYVRGDKSVTLSWAAPDDGGYPITGYRIQKRLVNTGGSAGIGGDNFGTDGGNTYPNGDIQGVYVNVVTTTQLTYTITNLTAGRQYTFRVFAINQLGDSIEATTELISVFGVPSVPLNFIAYSINYESRIIYKSWEPSADDGGSAITVYEIELFYNGVSQSAFFFPAIFPIFMKDVAVDPNVDVVYTVKAVNEVGLSPPATLGPYRFSTGQTDPTGVPLAPTNISVVPSVTSALVSWSSLPSDPPITGYKIICNPDNKLPNMAGPTDTSLNVTGLKSGTSYTFTVVAINATGSSYTATCTPSTVPPAPKVTAVAGNGQVTVSWPAAVSGVPTTGYTMTCNQAVTLPEVPTSPVVITGLTNGTSYTFSVTATNIIGTSAAGASKAVVPVGPPEVPTNVQVLGGVKSFQVNWAAPASTGGLPITEYTITYIGGGKTSVAKGKGVAPFTLMVSKLVTGTVYTVTMVAKNKVGVSASTSSVTVTVA